MDWTALATPVVVAIVPIVVIFIKKALSPAPWLIPPIAIVLGGLADALAAYVTSTPMSPVTIAIAGIAGVGLRELIHNFQADPAPKPPIPFARPRL